MEDLALAEVRYPGWAMKLLTHRVRGLENYRELFEILTRDKDVIKAYMEIGLPDDGCRSA